MSSSFQTMRAVLVRDGRGDAGALFLGDALAIGKSAVVWPPQWRWPVLVSTGQTASCWPALASPGHMLPHVLQSQVPAIFSFLLHTISNRALALVSSIHEYFTSHEPIKQEEVLKGAAAGGFAARFERYYP
jgi:hypothetical protein